MVKALTFKGDKKTKKRKRVEGDNDSEQPTSKALITQPAASTTTSAEIPDDDSWVSADVTSDISGPIIFVLPTDTPSCLSCDANGQVFTIEAENIVDGDSTTAEPHDVRQVWRAGKVAGTENFSFKSHHGRYLSCNQAGALSATTEAIGPEESFICIAVADQPGTFAVQTQREKYLAVDSDAATSSRAVQGNCEAINFTSTLRIRMQARFKPKLKLVKEEKASEKISRKELAKLAGRPLEDDEVKMLRRAKKEGNFREKMLGIRTKGKHDKWA